MDFVRPRLPDATASRQLADLLLLKLKVVDADCSEIAKEAVSLLVNARDDDQLREALLILAEESAILTLLPSFDEKAIAAMHRALLWCDVSCRAHLSKEYAQRLAICLDEDDRLKILWQLLKDQLNDSSLPWVKAAACLLCADLFRIGVEVSDLCPEVLVEAGQFLDDEEAAAAFAKEFFKQDLGISASEQWPPKSSAPIFHELALRMDGAQSEKLQMLMKAYRIDKDNGSIRASLRKHLNELFAVGDKTDAAELEGIFLELALEEGVDIPSEVLSSLTLEPRHLCQPLPKQLLLLANMLGSSDRSADGARVAVLAAKAFAASDKTRESEAAFVKAFCLDFSNKEAVDGIANAVTSAHKRCDELESRTVLLGVVWDLSGYDFTDFGQDDEELSEDFQIGSTGITASLSLYPRGEANSSEGMAGLFLEVDKPAMLSWTFQSGSGEVWAMERDFSQDWLGDGLCNEWGEPDFMPISETNGSITLRILSVQMPGSTLRFR